ncbi:unnamed protein product [Mytilus coruscus]|uniref:Uncharacterized protein n=1 Tax=Mytilus coruscus TaxID=42192 RepID=A0A6J8E133_MYTCO|nr:unnamed protein product [Mytilus coruscus]
MATQNKQSGTGDKSTETKRHVHADFGDDKVQNRFPFGWISSYNQRALCARILIPSEEKKHNISIPKILRVKFITCDEKSNEDPGYPWLGPATPPMTIDHFNRFLNLNIETFDYSNIENDYWDGILKLIEISKYHYESFGKVDQWTTTPSLSEEELEQEINKASVEQGRFVASFRAALKSDMKNGLGKIWMTHLIDNLLHIIDDVKVSEVLCCPPSDSCDPEVEHIYGDEDEHITQMQYNTPHISSTPVGTFNCMSSHGRLSPNSYSKESSVTSDGSCSNVKKGTAVPDFCAALKHFPGVFPLVVQLKPARQETQGIFPNVQQMLSKLFFQDVVFGLVISPRSFQMSVILKKEGSLRFASTNSVSLMNPLKDNELDMNNLNLMNTFVYQVLKWSTETQCSLEIEKDD